MAEQNKVEQWMLDAAEAICWGEEDGNVEIVARIIASHAPTPAPTHDMKIQTMAKIKEALNGAEPPSATPRIDHTTAVDVKGEIEFIDWVDRRAAASTERELLAKVWREWTYFDQTGSTAWNPSIAVFDEVKAWARSVEFSRVPQAEPYDSDRLVISRSEYDKLKKQADHETCPTCGTGLRCAHKIPFAEKCPDCEAEVARDAQPEPQCRYAGRDGGPMCGLSPTDSIHTTKGAVGYHRFAGDDASTETLQPEPVTVTSEERELRQARDHMAAFGPLLPLERHFFEQGWLAARSGRKAGQ